MKLFLVGGFLGSGKTTAIKNASVQYLKDHSKIGVITNDQGAQLVDSKYLQSFNIPTREVTNGCFCCNYDDLDTSIQSLLVAEEPEVIFAESVGSCTDIISTVVNPFKQVYPSNRVMLSVFADAHILPVLIQDESHFFDDKIHYIYNKQLEEADVLVVSKVDLLSDTDFKKTKNTIEDRYLDKTILYQNSFDVEHINRWLMTLNKKYSSAKRKTLDIDYHTYGEGEAMLGWLDGEVKIRTTDKNAIGSTYLLINKIYSQINKKRLPIGHLKFFLKNSQFQKKLSFTLVNQPVTEGEDSDYQTDQITVLINARVQASPRQLKEIVFGAIHEVEGQINTESINQQITAFKPDYPQPVHRVPS